MFNGIDNIGDLLMTPGFNLNVNTAITKTRKSLARFDAMENHLAKPESKNLAFIFEKESKRK